jgi:hypothetical protein
VKDYGVGLSVSDIENIYSKYGASTKRDTDDQVGMLGLGCKSALTYTDQFTMVSVKDGQRILATISRTERGTGVVEIVDAKDTTEPNGVEITIPVKFHNNFESKCNNFFRFWENGTVIVNGSEPEQISGNRVKDNMLIASGLNNDYIVMGNVGYRVTSDRLSNRLPYGKNVVAWVNIGEVSFTPSREDLQYNSFTKNTISRIKEEFREALETSAVNEINAAENHTAALEKVLEWSNITHSVDYTYKGIKVPLIFDVKHIRYELFSSRNSVGKGNKFYANDSRNNSKILYVKGYTQDDLSSHNRGKIRQWVAQEGKDYRVAIFVDQKFASPWLDGKDWISWEDIKVDRKKSVTSGNKQSYGIWNNGWNFWQDIPSIYKNFIVLSPATENRSDHINTLASKIQEAFPDNTIVLLNRNRWDKFKRENGGMTPQEAYDSVAKDLLDKLGESDRMVLAASFYDKQFAAKLDFNKIDDPNLVKFVKAVNDSTLTESGMRFQALQRMAREAFFSTTDLSCIGFEDYPLLRHVHDVEEAVYDYVNALFNVRANAQEGN